ncbi:MAG: hypothetical protein ABFD96_12965 [Armatimonadia bacterium]
MAQSTVLAAAQTAGQSSDITVAVGSVVSIGLFATVDIPSTVRCAVFMKGPSGAQFVGALTGNNPQMAVSGPGTFYVSRPSLASIGVNVGVYTEA